MENGEEERKRKLDAIAIYKRTLFIRSSLQEDVETQTIILEVLKILFKSTNDELKYLTTTHAEWVGEIIQPLGNERFIVKGPNGHRYTVICCSKVNKAKLISGTRVTLQRKTLTIMRILPPKINPLVCNMLQRGHCGDVSYSDLGGLSDQIKQLENWIELPLTNPEIFQRIGVKPPKGVLLYGPPGTGKTLLARAIASKTNSTFLTIFSSSLVEDTSLLVREIFQYARDHQPCIIFMDEIDAIGRRRSSQIACNKVLIELRSQLDGLKEFDKVKVIMTTNRPEFLDPALIRPGRIDKKIEIPLPNKASRMKILEIHASGITKHGEIDYEKVLKLSEGFNGADMRNICTEAGMQALRAERDYIVPDDFIKAVIKVGEAKKLESSVQ